MKKEYSMVCHVPIAGIQALTTIDFPGRIAAVLFTKGCPWQCRYCHNPGLRSVDSADSLSLQTVEEFLKDRIGFLEAVVLSGGEPTFHPSLPVFLKWIRDMGYKTALHTNGYYPWMLRCILKKGLVDYIAMDIKAPPAAYDRVTQVPNSCIAVARSVEIILSSGVEYEFRTTYHPGILSEQELLDTIHALSRVGATCYYLQSFRSKGVMDEELTRIGDMASVPDAAVNEAQKLFKVFGVR